MGKIEVRPQPHLWFFNKVQLFVRTGEGWAPKSLKIAAATNLDDVFVWEVSLEWHTGQTLSIAWFFSISEEYYSEASTVMTKRNETATIAILILLPVIIHRSYAELKNLASFSTQISNSIKMRSIICNCVVANLNSIKLEIFELSKPKLEKLFSKLKLDIEKWITQSALCIFDSTKRQIAQALTVTVPFFLVMTVAMKSSFF